MKRTLIGLFFLAAIGSASAEPAKLTIDSGTLVGNDDGTVQSFKVIPYAAPPVGELRWMPPAEPARWSGDRAATSYGPICPQAPRPDRLALATTAALPQSEDCLSLNVWTPKAAKSAPVMVWIHGGGHRFGSGASPVYDGANFAHDGIVLVTINYRLGILGYFAHPALTKAASADASLGNYGAMDQIAALSWVQRNIAHFGGDPKSVTVFGESAGGASILYLLATPSAHGLFAKAIVESGGGWAEPETLASKELEGADFATQAGLAGANATLAQLRAIPAEKTFDVPGKLGFGPFVDGRLVTKTPTQAFADGSAIHVPLIIGSNSYEASLMKSYSVPAAGVVANATPEIRAAYAADAASEESLAEALFTDGVMGAPAHWVASRASLNSPTYLYHFSYVPTARRGSVHGAAHGSEIPFVFGTASMLAHQFNLPFSDEDRATEQLIHACWVSFAKSETPDCAGKTWPSFAASSDALMEFGPNPGVVRGFRKAQYEALNARLARITVVAGTK